MRLLTSMERVSEKKKVRSKAEPGCVIVLVNRDGPTEVAKRKASLDDNDKRLSRRQRFERCTMRMDVITEKAMSNIMNEEKKGGTFHLTCFSDVKAEQAKANVTTAVIDGKRATEVYKWCLITETPNCFLSVDRLTSLHGMGSRHTKVRARQAPGCLVLLIRDLPPEKQGTQRSSPPAQQSAAQPAATAPALGALPLEDVAAKRPRISPPAESATATVTPALLASQSSSASQVNSAAALAADQEEKYVRQVRALEKRLAQLLPTLPREQLSTPFVQARLEGVMQKPEGRLNAFKMDIARIWRSFLEEESSPH